MKNVVISLVLALGAGLLASCSSAQLEADLKKVEACGADPRVDACVASAAQGAPEPETALACVQLCLNEPSASAYRLPRGRP